MFASRSAGTPPDPPRGCGPAWERPGAWPGPSMHLHLEEVVQHRMPVLRQDRLGMELHALERQLAVAHAHDLAIFAACRDLEFNWTAGVLDHQRVVADHAERARQPGIQAAFVGADGAGLAVHQPLRTHDAPT